MSDQNHFYINIKTDKVFRLPTNELNIDYSSLSFYEQRYPKVLKFLELLRKHGLSHKIPIVRQNADLFEYYL
ncbi:MAG: hypothetical protein F4Z14_00215 [Gammaproteobacteria bacterium]|nr:hypothetical protein [Gammaproteobacteria bacterium]